MNLLHNILLHYFLDDMMEIGAEKWGLGALFFGIIAAVAWGGAIFPFLDVIAVVMFLNLFVATLVTLWWKYRGREKYAVTDLLDLGEQKREERQA